MHGRAAVDVDDVELLLEVDLHEGAAGADAGVQGGRVEPPPGLLDPPPQLLDPVGRREVHADGLDPRAPSDCSSATAAVEPLVLGGDDQVEAVLGALLGELPADAARGPGDESEVAGVHGGGLPSRSPRANRRIRGRGSR